MSNEKMENFFIKLLKFIGFLALVFAVVVFFFVFGIGGVIVALVIIGGAVWIFGSD